MTAIFEVNTKTFKHQTLDLVHDTCNKNDGKASHRGNKWAKSWSANNHCGINIFDYLKPKNKKLFYIIWCDNLRWGLFAVIHKNSSPTVRLLLQVRQSSHSLTSKTLKHSFSEGIPAGPCCLVNKNDGQLRAASAPRVSRQKRLLWFWWSSCSSIKPQNPKPPFLLR